MNWRELLHTDLGALLWGLPPRESPKKTPRQPAERRRVHGPSYFIRKSRRWRDLRLLLDHLTALVEVNVPLARGLDAASRNAPSFVFKAVLFNLSHDLDSGYTLAQAMRRNPRFFPAFYADIVETGEETGSLPQALRVLRDLVVEMGDMRYRVRCYASYLGFVWFTLLALVSLIGAYIMPLFADILRSFGATAPASFTRLSAILNALQPIVAFTPGTIREAGARIALPVLVIYFALGAFILWRLGVAIMRRSATLRRWASHAMRFVPGLRGIVAKRILGHIAYVLERLLCARVPLDEALETAASLGVSSIYADPLRRAAARVRSGHTLKVALDAEALFPKTFRGFVSVGETSGLLPEALERVAQLYRRQVQRNERVLLDLLSPMAILAAGVVVLITFSTLFDMIRMMADTLAVP